jgi:MscS family membrane protein
MTDPSTERPISKNDRPVLGPALLSEKRMTRLSVSILLLSLIVLFCAPALPQLAVPSTPPGATKPDAPQDVLGRTTPRGTVLGLLTAGRKGDDDVAAEYLNTRLRGKAAAVLAHQLFVVLDRRLPARLNQLSDSPEGTLAGGLNRELVGTISTANGNVDVIVERVERGKSGLIWLFSSKTLESIPQMYEEANVVSVHDVLPGFLVNTRLAGIVLFEWIAVFVGMPLLYLLTVLMNRLFSFLVGLLRRSWRVEVLPKPVRLLLLAAVIRWLLSRFSLPLTARQFWSGVAAIIIIAACLWLFLLANSRVEKYVHRRLRDRNLAGTTSILRLGRRVIDVLGIFAAVVVTLHYFGVNPTAALAGLGVGGIAVALAAQKTLENVVGGVSLILDRAVLTGDTLKLGDIVGTVEDVGLRSTRIRTADRTVVIVPNGQIAAASLETLSARDKFWFHPTIGLRYDTSPAQIRSVADGIRNLLSKHSSLDQGSVRVRFFQFGASSLDLEIFAYVFARDWNHFLQVQEELLLSVMEIIQQAGTQIAFPPQTMYFAADSASDRASRARALAPNKEVGREATATKSA